MVGLASGRGFGSGGGLGSRPSGISGVYGTRGSLAVDPTTRNYLKKWANGAKAHGLPVVGYINLGGGNRNLVFLQKSGGMTTYYTYQMGANGKPTRRLVLNGKSVIRTNVRNNKFTKITNIPGNYYQKNGKYLGSWSRKFYKKVGNGYQLVNKSEINKLKTTGGSPIGAVGGVAMTRPGNVVRPGANGFTTRNIIGNSGNYERQYWNGQKWRA
jgi:hypothetical protein